MPELRKDAITDRWVIIATERGKRPHDFVVEPEVTRGGFCPFCPGNEHTTPPEILAFKEVGVKGFRAQPNRGSRHAHSFPVQKKPGKSEQVINLLSLSLSLY